MYLLLNTMNESFDLLSTMSPRLKKTTKTTKKPPTALALKKQIRRSSIYRNVKTDESIICLESSSDSSISEEVLVNKNPIIISDSESTISSLSDKEVIKNTKEVLPKLPVEKYKNIKDWLDNISYYDKNVTIFSEVSSIVPEDNSRFKAASTNQAASSTMKDPKRFDELFKKTKNCDKNIIEDSFVSDHKIPPKVSTEKEISDNPTNHSLNENNEPDIFNGKYKGNLNSDYLYEKLLDDLYGDSWRENRDEILISSKPRPKKKGTKTNQEPPKTERVSKKPQRDNLLKNLHKPRPVQYPWMKALEKLCDPDTGSENDSLKENKIGNDEILISSEPRQKKEVTKINLELPKTERISKKPRDLPKQNGVRSKLVFSNSSDDEAEVKTKPKKTTKSTKKFVGSVGKGTDGVYSFLASLSANVPVSQCNPTARIFKNNFKQYRAELVKKLFNLYNEKIFDNAILSNTPIEWNDRMRGTAGFCYCRKTTHRDGGIERTVRIVLSTKVVDSADRVRDTLVHEMCHAATWVVNKISDGHGDFWKAWADRAMTTFPELPPIRRCHQYVINTKYTYKCVQCGYSVGRHTKSLDTERKRCGYCYGKFEVFINKITKEGTKSVPSTPKKATGFALFVKENYADYKTPDMKHGDVMKLLGQKFSSMKV